MFSNISRHDSALSHAEGVTCPAQDFDWKPGLGELHIELVDGNIVFSFSIFPNSTQVSPNPFPSFHSTNSIYSIIYWLTLGRSPGNITASVYPQKYRVQAATKMNSSIYFESKNKIVIMKRFAFTSSNPLPFPLSSQKNSLGCDCRCSLKLEVATSIYLPWRSPSFFKALMVIHFLDPFLRKRMGLYV